MVNFTKNIGAIPIIITRPHYFRKDKILSFEREVDRYNEIAKNFATQNNIFLFDMNEFSKHYQPTEIFADYSHFNPRGHRLAAEALYQQLQPIITSLCLKKSDIQNNQSFTK